MQEVLNARRPSQFFGMLSSNLNLLQNIVFIAIHDFARVSNDSSLILKQSAYRNIGHRKVYSKPFPSKSSWNSYEATSLCS